MTNDSVRMEKENVMLIFGHRWSPDISLLSDVFKLYEREKSNGVFMSKFNVITYLNVNFILVSNYYHIIS